MATFQQKMTTVREAPSGSHTASCPICLEGFEPSHDHEHTHGLQNIGTDGKPAVDLLCGHRYATLRPSLQIDMGRRSISRSTCRLTCRCAVRESVEFPKEPGRLASQYVGADGQPAVDLLCGHRHTMCLCPVIDLYNVYLPVLLRAL